MKIPFFLESAYRSDHKLLSFVASAIGKIDGHVVANRMVFFPEYTDHGISHFELTLQTALDLASGPSRGLLTPIDAAILTVAVGLHDFGMHLTRDGFETLIAPQGPWKGIDYFDPKPWNQLWTEFYAEATRFDGRKLKQLFGEHYRPVRPPPPKRAAWEDFDYLLVGEFLRRHHPRLAHEIALFGLPGKDGAAIAICETESEDQRFLADVSGLIARSHGMDLRKCLEYLETKYHNRINPRRVHAAFLGVLLRIADYFQIQSTRAPSERTDVVSFQSELSDGEWKVHQAVNDIHNTSTDPEAIVVNASPSDVNTFLKLRKWLEGLQDELDRSWAILGEVYGLQNHNNLNLLGLKIRRVKSNLDDVTSFAKTSTYVPAKIAFEAANADLLKLLVAPLYSNDPGIGIRELLQNAVDAVREFDDLLGRHPSLASAERYPQETDVTLKINCDELGAPTEIVITDRGVGMTAEIVRDYFLKAGASFRRSTAWKEDHEDEKGHSRVLRTGRFGVGALAAFLLGDEIEVTTRNVMTQEDEGISFSARLDDEAISLNRTTCPVGTRITVKVPPRLRDHVKKIIPEEWEDEIEFDSEIGHYFLQKPSLAREYSKRPSPPVEGWLPLPEDDASDTWRCFTNSEFEKIFWTYDARFPHLSSNGIVIEHTGLGPHYQARNTLTDLFAIPCISVFDRDGALPVNLQRTGLQGELPFKEDLLKSIAEDVLACALIDAPSASESLWFDGTYEGFVSSSSRGQSIYMSDWDPWLIGKEGFVLNEPNLISLCRASSIVAVVGGPPHRQGWGEILRKKLPNDALFVSQLPRVFSDENPRIKGVFQTLIRGRRLPSGIQGLSYTACIPTNLLEKLKGLRPGRHVLSDITEVENSRQIGEWYLMGQSQPASWIIEALRAMPSSEEDPIAFCFFQSDLSQEDSPSPFVDRWMEIAGTPMIPFNPKLRISVEANARKFIERLLHIQKNLTSARLAAEDEDLRT